MGGDRCRKEATVGTGESGGLGNPKGKTEADADNHYLYYNTLRSFVKYFLAWYIRIAGGYRRAGCSAHLQQVENDGSGDKVSHRVSSKQTGGARCGFSLCGFSFSCRGLELGDRRDVRRYPGVHEGRLPKICKPPARTRGNCSLDSTRASSSSDCDWPRTRSITVCVGQAAGDEERTR